MASNGVNVDSIKLASKPSHIVYKDLRFLIMDRPTELNLPTYLRELKKAGVTSIVRVCEPSYSADEVEKSGIAMHDIPFEDGQSPPPDVVEQWLLVVKGMRKTKGCIAVHCVAGLGRAPVLVAVALIDAGMSAIDAVTFIRKERRGAINQAQINFLKDYERTAPSKACGCVVS